MSESSTDQRLDFWPDSGLTHTRTDARGWLIPQAPYWGLFLKRPELALVPESCAAETRLHRSLLSNPLLRVNEASLALLADADVRSNYRTFVNFRDAVQASGTLESFYLSLLEQGAVNHPPLFMDMLVQTITHHLVKDTSDALQARAAELLFRQQRITLQDGQLLSADAQALEDMQEDGGLGEIGRLLKESQAPMRAAQLRVLNTENADSYWAHTQHRFVLDLSHEMTTTLSHGLTLRLAKARSGLKALCDVLALWVEHFLHVQVRIEPLTAVEDATWRWHTGLDVSSSALLNALYEGNTLSEAEQARLISLFKLRLDDENVVQDDMVGKPVYLGLAMKDDQTLKLKPQNLLLNLPLKKAAA
jgi:hypothetical protein